MLLDPVHFTFSQLELLALLGEPEVVVLFESGVQSSIQSPAGVVLAQQNETKPRSRAAEKHNNKLDMMFGRTASRRASARS